MPRGKSVTLKGAAAAAFIDAKMGKKFESEGDRLDLIATMISMYVSDDMPKARMILRSVAKLGIEKTSDLLR